MFCKLRIDVTVNTLWSWKYYSIHEYFVNVCWKYFRIAVFEEHHLLFGDRVNTRYAAGCYASCYTFEARRHAMLFRIFGWNDFAENQRYSSTVNCIWTIPGLPHDVMLACHSSVAPKSRNVMLAYSSLKMHLSILRTSLIFVYFFQVCLSSTSYRG